MLKNTYLGFTDNLKPMQKTKVENNLDTLIQHNKQILKKKEFILQLLQAGYIPKLIEDYSYYSRKLDDYTKPKNDYRIYSQNDEFYNTVTKTEYDFANYIINNDLLDSVNIQSYITEENKRLQEQEEERLLKEKQQLEEKARKEKETEDFNNWLTEETKKYNDQEKLSILKEIFFHEVGNFHGNSIRLLVLIENIDNPLSKEKLKDWLSYYNTASLKTFFHITGINLGKTDKEIQARLDTITSKDFQGIIPFKPRKKAEEPEQVLFYILSNDNAEKKHAFQEARGEKHSLLDIDFFIQKINNNYNIIEGKTGLSVVKGDTKQAAIKTLKDKIKEVGIDKFIKLIEGGIERFGISPLYGKE